MDRTKTKWAMLYFWLAAFIVSIVPVILCGAYQLGPVPLAVASVALSGILIWSSTRWWQVKTAPSIRSHVVVRQPTEQEWKRINAAAEAAHDLSLVLFDDVILNEGETKTRTGKFTFEVMDPDVLGGKQVLTVTIGYEPN